jgi:hypothetical protein
VQRVRRYPPSLLLPLIAHGITSVTRTGRYVPAPGDWQPWALAVAARESIRCGTEHRSAVPTVTDLHDLNRLYTNLADPFLVDRDEVSLMTRLSYEQFPFQEQIYFQVSRSTLIYEAAPNTQFARSS